MLQNRGAMYYYITNLQGDVIRLVNSSGQTAAYYEYDPYGNPIKAAGSHCEINPLRYRGYVYDTETGLYYCQSRYYDPAIGRFINADEYSSTGQGIIGNNMFAYCGNNPIKNVDSGGHFFFTALGALTGFIGSALTAAVDNLITGSNNDVFYSGLCGAVGGAIAGAGVDVALVVLGSLGTAIPVVALAGGIAFMTGGIGNATTTYLVSNGEATDFEINFSFFAGGFLNLISFGLSTGAVANSLSGVSIAGMQQFDSNMKSGLWVATATSIATEVGTTNSKNLSTINEQRISNSYKMAPW